MHKRIVKAIELALTQRELGLFGDLLLSIFIESKETEGFWRMIVIPKKGYEHLLNHIEHIGRSIGSFYGEGLAVERASNYILFS